MPVAWAPETAALAELAERGHGWKFVEHFECLGRWVSESGTHTKDWKHQIYRMAQARHKLFSKRETSFLFAV